MENLGQLVSGIKEHLEHGAALVESHVPGLVAWAEKAEQDPLVQAALSLVVPDGTKVMLASLLKSVEADVQRVEADAAAKRAEPATPE